MSYSTVDAEIVKQVEKEFEPHFLVWRDERSTEVNWSREISQALVGSQVVCLFWSENAAKSSYVENEWLTATALEKPVVPCLLPGRPHLPDRLFNTQGIPFTGAWTDDRAKALPDLIERLSRAPARTVYDFTLAPPNTRIPYAPNLDIVGRSTVLADMYQELVGELGKRGSKHLGLVGLSGVGKTQLAAEFCNRFSFAFQSGIIWVHGSSAETLRADLLRSARRLSSGDVPKGDEEAKYILALFLDRISEQHSALLVVDNLIRPGLLHQEDIVGIGHHTLLTMGMSVLFTSQVSAELPGVKIQDLAMLTMEDPYALITRHRSPSSRDEDTPARSICCILGGLPLALVLAEAFLHKYDAVSFQRYLAELKRDNLRTIDAGNMSEAELATRHRASVQVALQIQFDKLASKDAKALLAVAGLFDSRFSAFPVGRLALLAGLSDPNDVLVGRGEQAGLALVELSFAQWLSGDGLRQMGLHPLVHSFAASLTKPKSRQKIRGKAARRLTHSYSRAGTVAAEGKARGIGQAIEDLDIALLWARRPSRIVDRAGRLRRILDLERHNFENIPGFMVRATKPSFLQQLHYRAAVEGEKRLARIFLDEMVDSGEPGLRVIAPFGRRHRSDVRSLFGHLADVASTSVTPDASKALSVSRDGTAIVWDVPSGTRLGTFSVGNLGDAAWSSLVAISTDGTTGAICLPGRLVLVDLSARPISALKNLLIGTRQATACCFASSGTLAVGYDDGSASIWDIASGIEQRTFASVGTPILTVAYTERGLLAAGRIEQNTHAVWVFGQGERLGCYRGDPRYSLMVVALSYDGLSAASGSADRTVRIWKIAGGETEFVIRGLPAAVESVSLNQSGSFGLASSRETILAWSADGIRPTAIGADVTHQFDVTAVAFNKDGRLAVSGSQAGPIAVWNPKTGTQISALPGFDNLVRSVGVNLVGDRVMATYLNRLRIWDWRGATLLGEWASPSGQFGTARLAPDGTEAVAHALNDGIGRYRVGRDGPTPVDSVAQWPQACAFDEALSLVACAFYNHPQHANNIIEVYDLRRNTAIFKTVIPQSATALTFTRTGLASAQLVIATSINSLILMDGRTGVVLKTIEGLGQLVPWNGLAADRGISVTSSNPDNQVLQTWHSITGVHTGARLVDTAIALWDIATGLPILRLVLTGPVSSLDVHGRTIAVGDKLGNVYFFELVRPRDGETVSLIMKLATGLRRLVGI